MHFCQISKRKFVNIKENLRKNFTPDWCDGLLVITDKYKIDINGEFKQEPVKVFNTSYVNFFLFLFVSIA